jgi:hypothetical protein
MLRLLFVCVITLCAPVIASAQEYPRVEVSGAYSYLRGDFDANFNGWSASVAGNPSRWFGVVGEFGGHYFEDVKLHTFLVGPKFTYRGERVSPYFQTLVGGAHLKVFDSDTAFAWTVGGGVDVKIHQNVAIRVIDVTYLLTRFGNGNQNNGRISAGLVFRFGNR